MINTFLMKNSQCFDYLIWGTESIQILGNRYGSMAILRQEGKWPLFGEAYSRRFIIIFYCHLSYPLNALLFGSVVTQSPLVTGSVLPSQTKDSWLNSATSKYM